jgi:beta-galactosidase
VHYRLKEAEPFLEKGYETAYEQFALGKTILPVSLTGKGNVTGTRSGNTITVSGKDFNIQFDAAGGTMQQYSVQKQELLQQGPQPAFWRAPTDNDIGAGFNHNLRMWRDAYSEGKMIDVANNANTDGSYEVRFKKELLNGDAIQAQTFTVYADGKVKVDNRFTAVKGKYPLLMRLGNNLQLNKQYLNMEWYGRGPGESYWDRKSASPIGIYKQTVREQYFPYARPQESGNKSDLRWVNFTNDKGKGLRVTASDSLLNVAALPYSMNDLDPGADKKQYHSGELTERNEIYLHIDLQQTGVQGMDSWGAWPLKQYRLPFANYEYSYWISPIR